MLITGAVRNNIRLHAADIELKGTDEPIQKECQICDSGTPEDNMHIFWHCRNPDQCRIRDGFLGILGKFANLSADEEERRITRDPQLWPKSLAAHGIMPKAFEPSDFYPSEVEKKKETPHANDGK